MVSISRWMNASTSASWSRITRPNLYAGIWPLSFWLPTAYMAGAAPVAANDGGWLTSKVYSPHLGHDIALGYLKGGDRKIGQRMRIVNLLAGLDTEVEIISPHMFDPEGVRLRG